MDISNQLILRDIDKNEYRTLIVGDKIWMADNLRVTHYNDGAPIPLIVDGIQWANDKNGAMCYYEHDQDKGALYNFYAVDEKKLAPEGWRVATDEDWAELGKVVEGWKPVLGGRRGSSGDGFYYLGSWGFWWSSTPTSSTGACSSYLASEDVGTALDRSNSYRSNGFSVRCVMDLDDWEIDRLTNLSETDAIKILKEKGYRILKPYTKFKEI